MNWYDNFPPSKILDRIYLGNLCNAEDLLQHNPLGITAVLNVSTHPPYGKHPGIIYMDIPFEDGEEIPARKFGDCIAFLKFMYENGHKVLIHCAAGISRSPSVVASFLHYMKIKSFEEAVDFIAICRPIIHPAPRILNSCRKWLCIWPYDGSIGMVAEEDQLHSTIRTVAASSAAQWHTDPACPVRQLMLTPQNESTKDLPRHLIQCTCSIKKTKLCLARNTFQPGDTRAWCHTCGVFHELTDENST